MTHIETPNYCKGCPIYGNLTNCTLYSQRLDLDLNADLSIKTLEEVCGTLKDRRTIFDKLISREISQIQRAIADYEKFEEFRSLTTETPKQIPYLDLSHSLFLRESIK